MASLKTWVVTTRVASVQDSRPAETVSVEAHSLTIEPSGALSFWAVTPDNMQAMLLFAFGAGHWVDVAISGLSKPQAAT